MRIPGLKKEKWTEEIFEAIMNENFPQITVRQQIMIQDAQRIPNRKNAKKPIPRHVFFKLQEIKDNEKSWKKAEGE